MAQPPDKKPQPEKPSSPRPPKAPRRMQIPLPFTVGSFSSVPSTERLLTSVLSGSPIILCVLDSQLNIAYIDGKGLDELRMAPGQLVGHPLFELLPDSQDIRRLCDEALAGNIARTIQRFREKVFRLAFLPVIHQNASVSGVILVATDVTNREREQALEPKPHPSPPEKDLVLQVTHELRTPLNSVLGFANLLLRSKETQLNDQDRFYLERIIGNTNHLLQVIGQVLDLSLHTAGKLTHASSSEDLRVVLEETLGELKGLTWSGSVTIVSQVPDGTLPVKTDRVKLKQILVNLVSNSLKYTSKGTITVSVHTDAQLRPVRIDVTDTGEGIPKERFKAIFEAFDRGTHNNDRMIEGVGLGLSIAQTLCTMLGYTISVNSEEGKGSTFSIHLVPLPTPL
ncbi:MAG TPA: hypothetical protein DEP53_06200 [Bacteroidetes bacterium]|nr:hypothetical protein [Bacteroidota bacterium]